MKHLDLFSGIGGFALAARWAGIETIAFCEIEDYPQKVLRKNFPGVPIHPDIRELNGADYENIDIITGGYPCQPFSRAGKQRGKADDRDLWSEMFRIIKQARPSWVVCENVIDHEYMGLDEVLNDMEGSGYSTRPLIIPAGAVQRNHARERLWVVAYYECAGAKLEKHTDSKQGWDTAKESQRKMVSPGYGKVSTKGIESSDLLFSGEAFSVAGQSEPIFMGGPHGIPNRLDRRRGLGNAIVPQVAYEIMRSIKEVT